MHAVCDNKQVMKGRVSSGNGRVGGPGDQQPRSNTEVTNVEVTGQDRTGRCFATGVRTQSPQEDKCGKTRKQSIRNRSFLFV